ncbi:MAG: efflux RND transporter periplasmic adaptor subunit [Chloroflexota bacterium]|nr:efflux RND transporter periplasmic adaptor subunit [Dehalococcoidia bacterium]MDW8252354.1 efflux RND transporter periplasmic adaptor subunit [Chloroflexota bacterium]
MTERALPHRRPIALRWAAIGALSALAVGAIALLSQLRPGGGAATPMSLLDQPVAVEARGRVVPETWANLAPTISGQVTAVFVREGQEVAERQELIRIESDLGAFTLVAPFRSIVAQVNAKRGETVLAGQPVVVVGDLSRFVIETTDLNEYGVARIRVGQRAELTFEALEGLVGKGVVRSIALRGQASPTGDITYPTVLEFDVADPRLRWGMTVRIRFEN